MAMDLPDGVGQLMMTESAGNIQASNRNTRGVFDAVMALWQALCRATSRISEFSKGVRRLGVFATQSLVLQTSQSSLNG